MIPPATPRPSAGCYPSRDYEDALQHDKKTQQKMLLSLQGL
jgi:hypothetical protein